ncbi:MAG: prepilin peptidase [Actinomycetales bacterium]|nr:prepilin peptidase [Actinomycetales bacterium]
MNAPAVLLTALLTGGTAATLTPWMRGLAATESGWLRSYLHVFLAVMGGAGAAALAHTWAELVPFAVLALACALLVVVDLAAFRLPDAIVIPMYPVLFATLTLAAAAGGEWDRLGRAAAAAGILLVVYFVLAFISPSGLGLGDVKLAGLLGAFLGWLGWSHVLLGSLAAFILSALVALTLLATRKATRGTAFPFGPWMVAGAAISAAWGPEILSGTA